MKLQNFNSLVIPSVGEDVYTATAGTLYQTIGRKEEKATLQNYLAKMNMCILSKPATPLLGTSPR